MDYFEYKVSVIVPVYNVEAYLRDCLDSLLAQTIDHELMEVLLINDGSTDNSLAICEEYAELFSMFKLFSKENEGLSATRNHGIERAKGKYLMYLDSDDMFTPETVEAVTDFFDTVYDEVDLVTYLDQPYRSGVKTQLHFRYNYLKKTGVYDLKDNPYICQTRVNICVKNLSGNNPLFDTTPNFRHEDQEYCSKVLMAKQKIGYCEKGEYCYNRSNEESIVSTFFHAYYFFETSIKYYENLASGFENNMPRYFQNMIFHDMFWKFVESILYPYHYEKDEFIKARERVICLLRMVDNDVIMSYPNADNYQKLYWIRQKGLYTETPIFNKKSMILMDGGRELYHRNNVEIILKRILVRDKTIKIIGYFKSPFFSYCDDFRLLVRTNAETVELPLVSASSSYYKAKEKTESFWSIIFEREITERTSIEFLVEFSGIQYETVFWNSSNTPFYKGFAQEYSAGELTVCQKNNGFEVTLSKSENAVSESVKLLSAKASKEIRQFRNMYTAVKKRIWLYYDNYTVLEDNGYYQFANDFAKDDGILRYYIHTRQENDDAGLFSAEMRSHIVEFGSMKHKILFLEAEKILTSFIEIESLIPFKKEEFYQILDIFNAEIIYLQHGVLHAHLPWYYTPIGVAVDKVVVSSEFEVKNFVSIYGFRKQDLIPTGMARYDHINKSAAPAVKKIIFAPSWRSYLIGQIKEMNEKRTGLDSKFINSSYYRNISEFLRDPRLLDALSKNNIEISVKLHPNFLTTYGHLIDFESEYVKLAAPNVQIGDFSLFITDFSSYVFDYAYLSRPIMYFVPDYLEFKSGMNRYRKLDLPWDEAFGNLTTDLESAVNEVIRIIENGFVSDPVFKERMDNFYLPLNNCSEKLYHELMKSSM